MADVGWFRIYFDVTSVSDCPIVVVRVESIVFFFKIGLPDALSDSGRWMMLMNLSLLSSWSVAF